MSTKFQCVFICFILLGSKVVEVRATDMDNDKVGHRGQKLSR